jgi:nickel superoxide dismutase
MLRRLRYPLTVSAHCDLPCGIYDPAQAKLEAQSVKACMEKYNASNDDAFKTRALTIKDERSSLVKHHLWVLWTDYFKPNHFADYPQLHELFNETTKLAGAAGTKASNDPAVADQLIGKIDEIADIFWATKKA